MSLKHRPSLRLLANMAGGFASRGINLGVTLLMVPLALTGLGTEEYAAFAVILSSATFVTYADFGLGLAMVNPLTAAEARQDHPASRQIIAETWSLLVLVAFLMLVFGVTCVAVVGLARSEPLASLTAWFVFVLCTAIGLPAAITQRVLFALERNYEANLWVSAGKLASLGGVYLAYHFEADLSGYVFAILGLPTVFGWINMVWLFRFSRRDLAPRFATSVRLARQMLPQGLRYTVLQIGPYAEIGFDVILVGLFFSPALTTSYDLLTRAFNYVPALALICVMPLWPAIRSALEKGHHHWADSAQKLSSFAILSVTSAQALVLAVYHPEILNVWTGHDVVFSYIVTLPLAFVAISVSYAGLMSNVILASEGAGRIYIVQLIFVAILIPLKIVSIILFGIAGLPVVSALLNIPRLSVFIFIARSARKRRGGAK